MIPYPLTPFGSLVHRDDDASCEPLSAAWRSDERVLVANAKARSTEPGTSIVATRTLPPRAV